MLMSRRDLVRAVAALAAAGAGLSALTACGTGPAGATTVAGTGPRPAPGDLGPVPAAVSTFSARLLQLAADPTANSVCSPLSAAIALSMTRLGAAGQTASDLDVALGIEDPGAWHDGMNTLTQVLASRSGVLDDDEGFVTLEPGTDPKRGQDAILLDLGNAVWLQRDLRPEAPFLDALARSYGAPVHLTDFEADPESAIDAVNDWCAEATRDKITEIVDDTTVTRDTRLILANAAYLRAAWDLPFQQDLTAPAPFRLPDGTEVEVPTMHGPATSWYEDEVCRATSRRYVGGQLAMALVQPSGTPGEVLDHWSAGGLAALLEGLAEAEVDLSVPTWDIAWGESLVLPLKQLGMIAPFEPGRADFSDVTEDDVPLHLSEVLQRAAITVDEEGTEAAAVTVAVGVASGAPADPPERHRMVLDRPFLFVVHDVATRVPLFLGVVADPSQRAG